MLLKDLRFVVITPPLGECMGGWVDGWVNGWFHVNLVKVK